MIWSEYQKPASVAAAVILLQRAAGHGRVVAGGTDLVLQIRQHRHHADLLVDITAIAELREIRQRDGWIEIGAAVTHAEAAASPLLRREAKALAEGCSHVGSPQIRNVATLAGNVITAQPAADAAIPLMALEAEIHVTSAAADRWIPIEAAYLGIGHSGIDPSCEVATAIRFRSPGPAERTAFFRLSRRKALSLPVLNGAAALQWDPAANRIRKARLALGPVAEKPFRPRGAESCLESAEVSPGLILEAARIAAEEAHPRTSLFRGSEAYRREMIRLYLARMLQGMLEREPEADAEPEVARV